MALDADAVSGPIEAGNRVTILQATLGVSKAIAQEIVRKYCGRTVHPTSGMTTPIPHTSNHDANTAYSRPAPARKRGAQPSEIIIVDSDVEAEQVTNARSDKTVKKRKTHLPSHAVTEMKAPSTPKPAVAKPSRRDVPSSSSSPEGIFKAFHWYEGHVPPKDFDKTRAAVSRRFTGRSKGRCSVKFSESPSKFSGSKADLVEYEDDE